MAVRPLTRNRQLQHRAFLTALARTGNVKAAATAVGMSDATLHYRRLRHADFAVRWDAAAARRRAEEAAADARDLAAWLSRANRGVLPDQPGAGASAGAAAGPAAADPSATADRRSG